METLWQDLRYGYRMLLTTPSFTAVIVIALALGIGATTTIFSVVNAVLLRPLPFKDPERILTLWDQARGGRELGFTGPEFFDLRDQNRVFENLAAYQTDRANLTVSNEPERIAITRSSADLFPVLGVQPEIGRTFSAEEDRHGADNVVVLSYSLWQRRFASDRGIIGQRVTLDGIIRTIVGVMPRDFQFPDREAELWVPLGLDPANLDPGDRSFNLVARLRRGVTEERAKVEMNSIASSLQQEYPKKYSARANLTSGINLVPLHEWIVGDVRLPLLILFAAGGFVLLIVCANVANMLLARAETRQKEIAIRTALGAGRARLIRQLLTESLLLALIGGGLGLFLALWGIDALLAVAPQSISHVGATSLDSRLVGFTLLVSLGTGVVFGLAPALYGLRTGITEMLKGESRGATADREQRRMRNTLVVSEIALALLLLMSAGLMINSFLRLQQVNPGFDPQRVLTMRISLPESQYPESRQVTAFYRQLLERLRSVPGIQSVGTVTRLPLSGQNSDASFDIEGRPQMPSEVDFNSDYRFVSPDYFKAIGMRLLKGRYFTAADDEHAPGVVIINESMARRYWPGEDPIGKRISDGLPQSLWLTIIGVVEDVKHHGLNNPTRAERYLPDAQMNYSHLGVWRARTIVVRTASDPLGVIGAVKEEVRSLDNDLPVSNVKTMEQVISTSLERPRFTMLLLVIFSGVALILAAIGIYGVMSYSVIRRTHELGIRMALGAQPKDILKLVVRQGFAMVITGVAIGLIGAFVVTRVLSSLLYGVSTTDPMTFAAVVLLLMTVALLACYVPARRATKVDPIEVLRYE